MEYLQSLLDKIETDQELFDEQDKDVLYELLNNAITDSLFTANGMET